MNKICSRTVRFKMSKVSIFLISKGKAFQSLIDLGNRPCVLKFALIHSRIVKPLKSGIKEKATSLNSKNMPHFLLLVYRLGPRKGGYNLPKGRGGRETLFLPWEKQIHRYNLYVRQ